MMLSQNVMLAGGDSADIQLLEIDDQMEPPLEEAAAVAQGEEREEMEQPPDNEAKALADMQIRLQWHEMERERMLRDNALLRAEIERQRVLITDRERKCEYLRATMVQQFIGAKRTLEQTQTWSDCALSHLSQAIDAHLNTASCGTEVSPHMQIAEVQMSPPESPPIQIPPTLPSMPFALSQPNVLSHISHQSRSQSPEPKRKKRTMLNPSQRERLETEFENNSHPDNLKLAQLSMEMALEKEFLRTWFGNRRQRMRAKQKEQERREKEEMIRNPPVAVKEEPKLFKAEFLDPVAAELAATAAAVASIREQEEQMDV